VTPSVEPVSVDAVRQALDKILASASLATAERLSRFLRFAVEEHLNGQTDKLKESFLGVELFGRKPSYDPRIDGVVRTEAVKLRARLKQYYDSDGRNDELIIDMPKGGYVPAFRLREKERAPLAAASCEPKMRPRLAVRWRSLAIGFAALAFFATAYVTARDWSLVSRAQAAEVPAIAVLPFVDLSPHHDQGYFSDGVTEEITDSLSRTGGFRVAATTSSFAFKGTRDDIREIGRKLNVGLALEGSLRKENNLVRVTAQLINAADGYHVWSETYERDVTDVFTVQDEISRAIVNKLRSMPR
jgi:serine/threonine-protein kinase